MLAGWAAAFVHGVDWLDGRGVDGRHLPVPLCVGPDVRRRSTERLVYTRARLSPTDKQVRFGLPVTSPMRTALDCARWAVDLEEAVVALDALARFDLVNLSSFAQYVADSPRVVGIRQVRQALTHAEEGVRSAWESRLRMDAVLEAGLPRLLVNPAVYDDRGRFVAIPDLLDVEAGLMLEYDGSGHRERQQHNADNVREEALERVGLTVVRADSLDYRQRRAQLVSRMRDGRRRGLDRDRRRDHWTLAGPARALDPYASLTDEDKEALFGNSGRASTGF